MKNVLGTDLKCCGTNPVTGYFRDGFCRTDRSDQGRHVIACIVDERFLDYFQFPVSVILYSKPKSSIRIWTSFTILTSFEGIALNFEFEFEFWREI